MLLGRSAFCQNQPVSDSKKPTRALSVSTISFTKYDDISFKEEDGTLYLVCEYSSVDFNSYRYSVTFDGENLLFTRED